MARPVSLPPSPGQRFAVATLRAFRRACPYCGGSEIFNGWFTLRDVCPHCDTRYANEDGYFLGSYVLNLVFTELLAVALVVYLIAGTDLPVVQMQIIGISIAIAMPLLFYPLALLLWVAIDVALHPPATDRPRP